MKYLANLWDIRDEIEAALRGHALLEEFFFRHSDGYHINCRHSDAEDEAEFMQKVRDYFEVDDSE